MANAALLPESCSFSLPCFVGQMLWSQFTSIPGTVFKGSKGEQREVSLSANNRKRTLFVRQLVSAIPFVEPTHFWTAGLVFHAAALGTSLERRRHGERGWSGGSPVLCCNSLLRRECFFKEQPEGRERKWWQHLCPALSRGSERCCCWNPAEVAAAGISCWTQLSCTGTHGEGLHSWILRLISVPKAGQGTLCRPEICCVVFWDDHRSIQNPYFVSFSWYTIKIETDMRLR